VGLWNSIFGPEKSAQPLTPGAQPAGAPGAQTGISSILPIIQNDRFMQSLRQQEGSEDPVVCSRWLADLWVMYVFDNPAGMQAVRPADLLAMQISADDLHRQAIGNLGRILPELQWHQNGPIYMASLGGTCEASVLLVDGAWEELASDIQADIVAAAPARDLLLFTSAQYRAGIDILRSSAEQFFRESEHPISNMLLRWSRGHWSIYDTATYQTSSDS
jgi:uncharacterized protein YtpQ (UPF0354 family)